MSEKQTTDEDRIIKAYEPVPCVNVGTSPQKFRIPASPGMPSRMVTVAPGEIVDVPAGYARPQREYDPDRDLPEVPSVLTSLAPDMVPADHERAAGVASVKKKKG